MKLKEQDPSTDVHQMHRKADSKKKTDVQRTKVETQKKATNQKVKGSQDKNALQEESKAGEEAKDKPSPSSSSKKISKASDGVAVRPDECHSKDTVEVGRVNKSHDVSGDSELPIKSESLAKQCDSEMSVSRNAAVNSAVNVTQSDDISLVPTNPDGHNLNSGVEDALRNPEANTKIIQENGLSPKKQNLPLSRDSLPVKNQGSIEVESSAHSNQLPGQQDVSLQQKSTQNSQLPWQQDTSSQQSESLVKARTSGTKQSVSVTVLCFKFPFFLVLPP